MSVLSDAWRRFIDRFGRPERLEVSTERDADVDGRLTDLEREQIEIAARLSILEEQGNPRGIGRG